MRLHPIINNKKFLIQWLLLLAVLFFLSAMVALNLYVNHQRTLERESDRLKTQARVLAENIQSQLGSANHALLVAAEKLKQLQNQQQLTDIQLQLKAIADSIPGIGYIGILDADGKLLYSSIPQYIGQNFAYRPYFLAVKAQPSERTLYISSPFKNKLNEYVISVSRMVAKPDGSFNGMVTAALDPKYFTTLMRSVLYAPDMWDAIAHSDGELFLMQPPHEMLYGTNMSRPGSMFTLHRASGKNATVFAGKVQVTKQFRLIAQHTVQAGVWGADNTLIASVSRDYDAVFEEWRHDLLMQLGLLLVIYVSSIFSLHSYHRRQQVLQQQARQAQALADRLSLALDHIPAYIYMKNLKHEYVYANKPTLELFKCSAQDLIGSDDARFFPPETVAQLNEIDTRVFETRRDNSEQVVSSDANGQQRVYWEVKTPIYDDSDPKKLWGLCGISTDITSLKLQEAALRESEKRFHSTFASAPIGMAILGLEGQFIQVNAALADIVGYSIEDLQKKTFQQITYPEDLQGNMEKFAQLRDGLIKSYQLEMRYFHQQGNLIWVLMSVSAVRDEGDKALYYIAQIQNITERKYLIERLESQARVDYLTNLSNRRYFMELAEAELSRSLRYQSPLALLMIDIDHFKLINDSYGHKTGDMVLQKLSDLLKQSLREVDILGRIGGEEFAILLPESKLENAIEVAERLRVQIANAKLLEAQGKALCITVSVGVAMLDIKNKNLDVLFNQADEALYKAKNSGRNCVCVAAK
jgi:diguanylate cyclase (GGDEF)-like protein/PAS domain S-box-containing protein